MRDWAFLIYSFLCLIAPLQAEWLPLHRLSLPEQKATFPQIVIDAKGNQTAIWQGCDKNHSIIQSSTKPYKGEWQPIPTCLSLGEEEAGLPQIVVDKNGQVTAIWDQFDGKNFIIHTSIKPPNGQWQLPPDQISPQGESAFNPHLAIDSLGHLTAVWEKFDGKHFIIQASTKRVGESWQMRADSLSCPDENACFPQVVLDSNGNATAFWHQCGSDHVTKILSSSKPYEGTWQTIPELVSLPNQDAFDLQAAVDSVGCVTVAWNGFDGAIWVNQKQNQARWQSSPDLLSYPGRSGASPHLATDGLGRTAVVWSESQGTHAAIQFAMKTGQGNWEGTPYFLSQLDREASHPHIAMNEAGDICLVWCEKEGNHARVYAITKTYEGQWKQESDFLSPPGHHALFPQVAFHPNGMPVVTWQQFVHQDIFIHATEKIAVLAPRDFNAKVMRRHLASATEYVHALKWEKSLSPSIDHYLLFQNDHLIAKISKHKKRRWIGRYQPKNKKQLYTLVAVNKKGWESPPLKLSVPFKTKD